MGRLWFIALDTSRFAQRLRGAAARALARATFEAARATSTFVLDSCVIPCGVRAVVRVPSRNVLRAMVRRLCAAAAEAVAVSPAHRSPAIWRSARIARVSPSTLAVWRDLIARGRAAFAEGETLTMQTHTRSSPARVVRKGVGAMRVIDRIVDAVVGADETAARLRRYVAEHDAPADDRVAFGRLCEVVFAQGIGFRIVQAKRPALIIAFEGFDPARIAAYDSGDVRTLLAQPIIRNEQKIRACIENASRWCAVSRAEGSYLGRVARLAAEDDPRAGWPGLTAALARDFTRINETGARQTLKRWGFFTAFAHPGAQRVIERLGFVDANSSPAGSQLVVGALARALTRDPYAVEGSLSLFAALGPCRPQPKGSKCALSDRCPTGISNLAGAERAVSA